MRQSGFIGGMSTILLAFYGFLAVMQGCSGADSANPYVKAAEQANVNAAAAKKSTTNGSQTATTSADATGQPSSTSSPDSSLPYTAESSVPFDDGDTSAVVLNPATSTPPSATGSGTTPPATVGTTPTATGGGSTTPTPAPVVQPAPAPAPAPAPVVQPAPAPAPVVMTTQDKFDYACQKVLAAKLSYDESAEIAILCSGGKATATMVNLAKSAYTGVAGTGNFSPIKLSSSGNTTELIMPGAIKFPVNMAQIDAKAAAANAMSVNTNGVSITNVIQQTYPAVDAVNRECYKVKETITSQVSIMTINDQIMLKTCGLSLTAADPIVRFIYSDLFPGESVNSDNRINKQISIMVQTGDQSVYGFTIYHMTVDNKGFASIAESKIKSQPPAIAAAYYNIMTSP